MIIKVKQTLRDALEALTHGGKDKIDPARREILMRGGAWLAAAGVLTPAGVALSPKTALAQALQCESSSGEDSLGSAALPYISLCHRGGAQFADDLFPGGPGGQLDFLEGAGAYFRFGYADDDNPRTFEMVQRDPDTGAIISGNIDQIGGFYAIRNGSGFQDGFESTIIPEARNTFALVGIPCLSENDRRAENANIRSPLHVINQLGRTGEIAQVAGYTSGTLVSGNQDRPVSFGEFQPAMTLTNASQARNAGGQDFTYRRITQLVGGAEQSPQDFAALTSVLKKLSRGTLDNFSNLNPDEQREVLVACGYEKAGEIPAQFGPAALDPSLQQSVIDAINDTDGSTAAVAWLVLNGYVGVGGVAIGSADNHNGSANSPLARRRIAGVQFAEVVNLCYTMTQARRAEDPSAPSVKCFVQVSTDGGMGFSAPGGVLSTENSTGLGIPMARYGGDSSSAGMMYCAVIDPDKTTEDIIDTSNQQIGWVTPSGVNAGSSLVAANMEMQAALMCHLWLQAQGREDELGQFFSGTNPFIANDEEKYHMFKNIFA